MGRAGWIATLLLVAGCPGEEPVDERYGSRAGYLDRARRHAAAMEMGGFLLPEDVAYVIERAIETGQ